MCTFSPVAFRLNCLPMLTLSPEEETRRGFGGMAEGCCVVAPPWNCSKRPTAGRGEKPVTPTPTDTRRRLTGLAISLQLINCIHMTHDNVRDDTLESLVHRTSRVDPHPVLYELIPGMAVPTSPTSP
jgi:hypothetical protein